MFKQLAIVYFVIFSSNVFADKPGPIIEDLGSLGGPEHRGNGINKLGQIAGFGRMTPDAASRQAFLWTPDSGIQSIGTWGQASIAYGLNDLGQVVGQSFPQPFSLGRAFLWSNGEIKDIGTLGGMGAGAEDINNHGSVVGTSTFTSPNPVPVQPFFWNETDGMVFIGSFGGEGRARAINNFDEVTGWSQIDRPTGLAHAYFWSEDSDNMIDIGVLPEYNVSLATDLNDLGQVVGWCRFIPNRTNLALNGMRFKSLYDESRRTVMINDIGEAVDEHIWEDTAFIWEASTGMRDLPILYDGQLLALGINNLGEIVGTNDGSAVLWNTLNEIIDLNAFLPRRSEWVLTVAKSINDDSQITGWGLLHGEERAFRLSISPLNKATICHNGRTIEISQHAVEAHLMHGDTLGECGPNLLVDLRRKI